MFIKIVSAHEAYVLPYDSFWTGLHQSFSSHAFDALKDYHNLILTLVIAVSVWVALGLNFVFRRSTLGHRTHVALERFSYLGPHFVRIAIASALLFSGFSNDLLGPELHGQLLPFALVARVALIVIGLMIAVGFLTELAALTGLIIYVTGYFVFGGYIFTYLNYFGELLVLLLFGLRNYSVDFYLFGPLKRLSNLKKYETTIVRVFYGIALIYAAVTVKLLHPEITISVIKTWDLTQFHWLFPGDPLLVALGAAIVEIVMGLFILIGFQTRLTVLISLFYITLSLLFFRELVWPHLLLYGISFSLLVQPEVLALDNFFFNQKTKSKT